ncbi:mitochondrial GTPase [Niveomyces insectorum RCEF 264]|uniref:Mitochondrial GTPase n=1 Tax=Niveomyces insectorum RCEF 264 TaxID=1081102 RepID=A0A167U4Z8_9HYPO|nr:mitochondrial GTPase [Niveomyces insectorum RCEF 264]
MQGQCPGLLSARYTSRKHRDRPRPPVEAGNTVHHNGRQFLPVSLFSSVAGRPGYDGWSRTLAPRLGTQQRRAFAGTTATAAAPFSSADDATIYALSSAPGKAGIAVIRVSGPACLDIYRALCPGARPLRPRYAAVRTLYDPDLIKTKPVAKDDSDDAVLDNQAVVLYFAAPRTVTGEDVLELHVHGGPATTASSSPPSLPDALGAVEAEGIRRARQQAAHADVVVALASVERRRRVAAPSTDGGCSSSSSPCYVRYDAETLRLAAQARQGLVVLNKWDVAAAEAGGPADQAALVDELRAAGAERDLPLVTISCRAAEAAESADVAPEASSDDAPSAAAADPDPDPGNIRGFVDGLVRAFAAMTDLPPEEQHLLGVTARQQQLLVQCDAHLADFLAEAEGSTAGSTEGSTDGGEGGDTLGAEDADRDPMHEPDVVLAAEHLRYAADCLARITGRGEASDIEEVLGVIFEK